MQLSTLTDVDECPRSNVTGSRGSFQTPETTKPSHFCEGFVLYGAGTKSRTRDLLITSHSLVKFYEIIRNAKSAESLAIA